MEIGGDFPECALLAQLNTFEQGLTGFQVQHYLSLLGFAGWPSQRQVVSLNLGNYATF